MKLWKRKPHNPTKGAGAIGELYTVERFLTDHVFQTKQGQLGVGYQLQGIDASCLTDETLDDYTKRLATSFRLLDEDFRIYQYLIKHDGTKLPIDEGDFPTAVRHTLEDRKQFLEQKGLYSISLYLVIVLEPKANRNAPDFLMARARSFERSITDLLGLRLLDKTECFRLFRLLANLDKTLAEAETLRYDNYLNHWMGSATVVPSWDGICVDLQHVEVLTMRDAEAGSAPALPRVTGPNLLKAFLALNANFILTTEFRRERNDAAVKAVNAAQNHFKIISTLKSGAAIISMGLAKLLGSTEREAKADIVPDESSMQNIEDLKQTIVRLNNQGDYLGHFSATVILHSRDYTALQGATTDAIKIVGDHEGSLVRETINALNAYRAIIPGGNEYNHRYVWNHFSNYIDMSLLYAPHAGSDRNKHLNAPNLITLETPCGTPYGFNLHHDDLLGFLEIGIMGSGKSFCGALMMDHSQKYRPFTFVLDIGGSYQHIAHKHGGAYVPLARHSKDFTINPFAMTRSPETHEFLSAFVHVLLETTGYKASPQDCRAIDRAVESGNQLSALDLPEHIKEQLYNWTGDGRYAHLFDNPADTLQIEAFQCFDFQGVSEKVLGPLFFYIFHRISEVVYNPSHLSRYKQLFADEVWKILLDLPSASKYIIGAGKTWRKHNGGIGLITQSALDLDRVGMLDAINEICPTKIFFANPGADRAFYQRTFHMNNKEAEMFASLIPKKQVLVMTPERSVVLDVNVDPLATAYYANDPTSNLARIAAQAQYGVDEGLRQLAKGA